MKQTLTLLPLLLLSLLAACTSLSPNTVVQSGEGPVELRTPSSVRILSVDGIAMNSPSLYNGEYILRLSEGEHRLVAQYEENWNTPDDLGHVIRWPQLQFTAQFQAGGHYRFQHPAIASREQAEQLASSTPLQLLVNDQAQNGQQVRVVQQLQYQSVDGKADPLKQLQAGWQALSNDDKAAFRQWLQQQ